MSNVLARFAAPIAAVLLAAAAAPALAEEQFDLDVQLGISAEMAARLTPNDTIQITLGPRRSSARPPRTRRLSSPASGSRPPSPSRSSSRTA